MIVLNKCKNVVFFSQKLPSLQEMVLETSHSFHLSCKTNCSYIEKNIRGSFIVLNFIITCNKMDFNQSLSQYIQQFPIKIGETIWKTQNKFGKRLFGSFYYFLSEKDVYSLFFSIRRLLIVFWLVFYK